MSSTGSSVIGRPVRVPGERGSQLGAEDWTDLDEEFPVHNGEDGEFNDEQTDIVEKKSSSRTRSSHQRVAQYSSPADMLKTVKSRIEEDCAMKLYDDVIANRIRAIALSRILFGANDRHVAEAHVLLASAYLDYKGYGAQGKEHSETARDIMLQVVSQCDNDKEKEKNYGVLAEIYYCLGHALFLLKKYAEAEKSLQKVDRIGAQSKRHPTKGTDATVTTKIKVAKLQGKLAANQGKHASAVTYLETAVDLIEGSRGTDDLELIEVYQMLGRVEQGHQSHEKALEAYLQAHSIAAANYSDDSLEYADATCALADSYAQCGDPDADTTAETFYNETIAGYQTLFGPHHIKTLSTQDALARLMIRANRCDEATQLLKATIAARQAVYGELSEEVASSYKLIGSVYLSEGNNAKALANLRKSKELFTLGLGAKHKKTKSVQSTIDVLLSSDPSLTSQQSRAGKMDARPRWG